MSKYSTDKKEYMVNKTEENDSQNIYVITDNLCTDIEPLKLDINDIRKLPDYMKKCYNQLITISNNIAEAQQKAAKAQIASKKAQEIKAGIGKKKEAITELQNVVVEISDANISLTNAQKQLFENQRALSNISKGLLMLGCSNIAMNRSVVRELELKLQGASAEEISDLAQQELLSVVTQLKAQEDIMLKQDKIMKEVKANHEGISQINEDITKINSETDKHETAISDNADRIEKNKKELTAQHLKDEEHDRALEEHNKELTAQHLKDEEHDKALEEHSKELATQHLKDEELEKRLADLLNIFSKFEQDTNEQNRANEGYLNEIRKQLSDISIADENGRKELSERADSLQNTLNKKGFKISVSAVAILSLILNLLQIFGVITPLF